MRLVAGVLALSLFASFARAEDTEDTRTSEPAGPAADVTYRKVPLRVVRIMAESHQALLFDRPRATHVLAEVGGKIGGYTVEAIDEDAKNRTLDAGLIGLQIHGGNTSADGMKVQFKDIKLKKLESAPQSK